VWQHANRTRPAHVYAGIRLLRIRFVSQPPWLRFGCGSLPRARTMVGGLPEYPCDIRGAATNRASPLTPRRPCDPTPAAGDPPRSDLLCCFARGPALALRCLVGAPADLQSARGAPDWPTPNAGEGRAKATLRRTLGKRDRGSYHRTAGRPHRALDYARDRLHARGRPPGHAPRVGEPAPHNPSSDVESSGGCLLGLCCRPSSNSYSSHSERSRSSSAR